MTSLEILCFGPLAPKTHARLEKRVEAGLRDFENRYPLVSHRVQLYESPDEVDPWVVVTAVSTTQVIDATGSSLDADEAVDIFLGELEERAAIATYRPKRTLVGSARSLERAGKRVFDCASLLGQPVFPRLWTFGTYSIDEEYEWAPAISLEDGCETWIPLCLIAGTDGRRLSELTSIGCAFGESAELALERAHAELAERDALRIAWFLDRHPSPIPRRPSSVEARDVSNGGWETMLFFLGAADSAGVVIVYARDPTSSRFAIGSAFGTRDEATLSHAVRECYQARLSAWFQKGEAPPKKIESFDDRLPWYSNRSGIHELDMFFGLEPKRPGRVERTVLESLPPISTGGGVYVLVKDEPGRSIVRMVLPDCQPMESAHAAGRKTSRLLSIAGQASVRDLPHPFG